MSRQEKLLWLLAAGILILLFLMSSTDWIIKERKPEVYPISVIIDDSKDDYYQNFRKGMEQAAIEANADVRFITLYERNSSEQQIELLLREMDDDARAVILVPVDQKAVLKVLDGTRIMKPVIVADSGLGGTGIASSIGADEYEEGRKIAEGLCSHTGQNTPVYLFSEGLAYGDNSRIYDGVMSVLSEKGYAASLYEKKSGSSYREIIESAVYPGSAAAAIIALDTASLAETAGILEESDVYRRYIRGLYGPGFTIGLLNDLDRGVITGIGMTDEYNVGYLSVMKAVEAIETGGQRDSITLDSFYIERSQIRDPEYEMMLYPID